MLRKRFTLDDPVIERAEFIGRTVKKLCQLLKSNGDYRDVSERIERTRGALGTIRVAVWQRELVRTVRSSAGPALPTRSAARGMALQND